MQRRRFVRRDPSIKRPYATYYYVSVTDRTPTYSSHGACSSEVGAVRASVPRLFLDQYAKCVIVDRFTGIAIYTVKRTAAGISVHYGHAEEARPIVLRRVA